MKNNYLVIGCTQKNLNLLNTLLEDKEFIISLAALKFDKLPNDLILCINCISNEMYKNEKKEKK